MTCRQPGDMLTKELKAIDPDMPVIICTGGSERVVAKLRVY